MEIFLFILLLGEFSTLKIDGTSAIFNVKPWPEGGLIAQEDNFITINCSTTIQANLRFELSHHTPAKPRFTQNGQTFHLLVKGVDQMASVTCLATYLQAGSEKTAKFQLGTLYVNPANPTHVNAFILRNKRQIKHGFSVNLTCQVESAGELNRPDIAWIFSPKNKTRKIVLESREEFCQNRKGKVIVVSILEIKSFSSSNVGIYKCIGTLPSLYSEDKVDLALEGVGDESLSIDSNYTNVIEGQPFTLKCKVKEDVFAQYVEWYHATKLIKLCSMEDLEANTCTVIITNPTHKWSSGTYYCVAHIDLQSITKNISVTFLEKVSFDLSSGSTVQLAKQNVPVNLVCKIKKGFPLPLIKWHYQIWPCKSTEKCSPIDSKWQAIGDHALVSPKQTTATNQSILTIQSGQDSAYYKCIAKNTVSKKSLIFTIRRLVQEKSSTAIIVGSVVAVVFILTVSILTLVICRKRIEKKYAPYLIPNIYKMDPNKTIFEQSSKLPYDTDWEFPRKRINMIEVIGSGAFGEVWVAEAIGILTFNARDKSNAASKRRAAIKRERKNNLQTSANTDFIHEKTKVAIKTLKPGANHSYYKDLASELKILIHIGSHKNIVNLLGACTTGGKLYVILEYCSRGALRTFLRDKQNTFIPSWEGIDEGLGGALNFKNLTTIAFQIARGMEFLSSKKCIHRDLAARNILITDNYVMKIADFGLARDVVEDNFYLKQTNTKEPVKWMAYESLAESEYTTLSDIWSYGVLLWEIFALGATPYPGVKNEDLFFLLASGKRMEKPQACPVEIFDIMNSCWLKTPEDRIPFHKIADSLEKCLLLALGEEEEPYLVFDNTVPDNITEVNKPSRKNTSTKSKTPSIKKSALDRLSSKTFTNSKLCLVSDDCTEEVEMNNIQQDAGDSG